MEKTTKQEKERIAEEKRIARQIAYENGHFFLTWTDEGKNGQTRFIHDVINGTYDEEKMAVLFKLDSYSLYYAVDNHMGGLFLYRLCKTRESSSKYNRYSKYSKNNEKDNKEYLPEIIGNNLTIESLMAKAKIAKGFKPMTNARELEGIGIAQNRANTVYKNHLKAEERKAQKEESTKAEAV